MEDSESLEENPEEENIREQLYQVIQGSISESAEIEGSILLGFVLVAEWKSPNGQQWLTKLSGDSFEQLPPWRERMFGLELMNWENQTYLEQRNEDEED